VSNSKRILIIALLAIALISAALIIGWVRHTHAVQALRDELDAHLNSAVSLIEQNQFPPALEKANAALELAQQLNDDEAFEEISTHVMLISAVERANDYFTSEQYVQALYQYNLAAEHSAKLENLGSAFIKEQIALTESFIRFYELLDNAAIKLAHSDYQEAFSAYQLAFLAAHNMGYATGMKLAEDGMSASYERLMRIEAEELSAQGRSSFIGGYLLEAIEYFSRAEEIFLELGDESEALTAREQIEGIERRIEQERALAQALERAYRLAEEERERQEARERRLAEEKALVEWLAAQAAQDSQIAAGGGEAATYNEQTEEAMALSNYQHNRDISFDLTTLIDNQAAAPANQVRMGTREGLNEGWYNGCGWIAAYNSLIILGDPRHPAQIVNHFETNRGTVAGGVFGTFPHAIERYFRELGYEVNHTMFPQRSAVSIDDTIRASRVAVLAYMHTRAAHFITIEYRPETGRFVILNDSFARRRSNALGFADNSYTGSSVDSVMALLRETPEMLFAFSLITVS